MVDARAATTGTGPCAKTNVPKTQAKKASMPDPKTPTVRSMETGYTVSDAAKTRVFADNFPGA
ncbi:MAG: hypothetical protein ACOYMC_05260 [Pirellulales bacterium]